MKSEDLKTYCQYAIQTDIPKGLEFLRTQNSPYYQEFYTHINSSSPLSQTGLLKETLEIYFAYFRLVLPRILGLAEGEKWLAQKLQKAFGIEPDPDPTVMIKRAEEYLQTELGNQGYFFLGGKTLPYWGPYVYAKQENLDYLVELYEGVEPVRVVFMHDFHCMGWLNFATMGHIGTGGWAKEDALYCVASKWDRNSDDFMIHYLKHEAQHKRDLRCFPQLKQDQETMEFRAKLSELIYSPNINTLTRFIAEANPDSNAPHSRASAKIAQHLSVEWDIPTIQSRSREMLFESSEAL